VALASINRKLCSQRGLTLIELLVAAVVFAIVVVALVEFYYWGRARIMEVGLRRSALAQAQGKMEELRVLSFIDADLADGTHGPQTVQIAENLTGTQTWSVTTSDDPTNGYTGSEEDYKAVVITVTWSWEHINSDEVTLTGLFYR
jgi:prepilin-type N-terminal cleavage/methylation domain-containing protein